MLFLCIFPTMVILQGKRNTVQEGPDPLLFQLRACSTVYFYQGDHASVSIETVLKYGFAKNGCVVNHRVFLDEKDGVDNCA